jgi:hypothetical protein
LWQRLCRHGLCRAPLLWILCYRSSLADTLMLASLWSQWILCRQNHVPMADALPSWVLRGSSPVDTLLPVLVVARVVSLGGCFATTDWLLCWQLSRWCNYFSQVQSSIGCCSRGLPLLFLRVFAFRCILW